MRKLSASRAKVKFLKIVLKYKVYQYFVGSVGIWSGLIQSLLIISQNVPLAIEQKKRQTLSSIYPHFYNALINEKGEFKFEKIKE